jgi:glutamate dehydrogenase
LRRLRRELIELLTEALRSREQTLPPRTAAAAVGDFMTLLAQPAHIGVHWRLLARGELYRHVLTLRCPDQAFYLDAIKVYLSRRGIDPIAQLAVVACTAHAPDGSVASVCGPQSRVQGNEMLIVLHVSATLVPDGRGLAADLKAILAAVAASVRDFGDMAADLKAVAGHLAGQAPEDAALLGWMLDKRYLMFGLMEGKRRLGILANRRTFDQVAPGLMPELLACRAPKGPGVSWLALPAAPDFLYGPVPLEVVRIAWRDGGHKGGQRSAKIRCVLLVGYFARSARHTNAHQVPRLSGIWDRMRRRTPLVRSAYLEREVRTVFDRVPKPILLTAPEDALAETLLGIVEKGGPGGAHVYVWDAGPWLVRVVTVVLPLNRFSAQVQENVLEVVHSAGLEPLTHHNVAMGTSLVMFITCHGGAEEVSLGNLTQAVREAAISWRDRALQAIRAGLPTAQVRDAIQTLSALPRLYTDMFAPETFVEDLKVLRRVRDDGRPHVRLEAVEGGVTMYAFTALPVPLGHLVEIVQAFGLAALDEAVVDIPGDPPVHLTRLRCGYPEAVHADALPRLRAALEAVLADLADSDPLNALVLGAGLETEAVAVLVTLRNHLVQLVPDASPGVLTRTLVAYPPVTSALYAVFAARHHPDLSGRENAAREAFTGLLGTRVENLTDDRWYRVFADLVGASLRTNAYTRGPGEPIAVKVKPADLPYCPHPVPYREIFVHSRHMEGVHLRGGPIARGGLRLSDRPTDFRTEVLELMATQVVKNGVIVPTGAKGGFVLKAGAGAAFAREQYRAFVRSLLSVTDNLAHGKSVAPRGVQVHPGDEADPYLVVAADKGTATFSDLANDEAAKADFWPTRKGAVEAGKGGFWLGDAFASGGSQGYDHKKYGITARGAWVSVRHHFAGIGVDPEREPVTAVGIGDMGGDVFGNGMLLSRTLRLVAAFNHRHVFLDPDPNPKAAFAERRRLFDAGAGWDGYRAAKLSQGGGVFDRTAKRIPVSPEAAKVLGIEPGDQSGEALIRAILCAPVDLLYNGGIGTYVRAPSEPDVEARDPANKAVRVTSDRLRCKVVGEGGNLGFTQRARIDFARRGGLIHTDAIDNSGGVDMSDHEVNLKILLASIPGAPTAGRRNRLLKELGDEVADLCLADSRSQARALSVAAHRVADYPALAGRLRDRLVADGRIEPADAGMGEGDEETLATKPQLSVLMGHEKNRIKAQLEEGGFAAHSCFAPRLLSDYFPPRVAERYRDRLSAHPLKDGIVHTVAASRMVARFGLFAFARLQGLTGAGAADAAQALFAAEALLSAEELRLGVWDLPAEPAVRLQADLQDQLAHLGEELLRLCPVGSFCDEWVKEQRGELTRFRHLVIREGRGGRGAGGVRGAFARRMAEARKAGLSEPHAAWAAAMPELTRVAVPLHLAGKLEISLWRCLTANRAAYALLPLAVAEAQLRAPGWGADDDTNALRVAWMRRLTHMRAQAVERLLSEGPRDPGAAGRRMWRRHPDWAPIRTLAGELEGLQEAEPIKTALLLTRLESLVDAPGG